MSGQRILFVAPEPFYEDRGTPIAVRHVLEGLTVNGVEVDLLTYPVGKPLQLPGLRIFRGPNPLGFRRVPIGFSARKLILDLVLVPTLRRLIASGEYGCVHAVEESAFLVCFVAASRRVRVIYDMQSSIPESLAFRPLFRLPFVQRILKGIELWALRRATSIVCSAGLKDYVDQRVPGADVHEWLFPASFDLRGTRKREDTLAELGIASKSKVVVYTGNFEQYQGLQPFLKALPLVVERIPEVVFLLVGAQRLKQSELIVGYEDYLRRGQIVIVERQPRARIKDFLAVADVLVSPREAVSNIPLKIFEYMQAGKPIVASDCNAHRAVLDPCRARLVSSEPEAWSGAIIQLLLDPPSGAALAANAKAFARRQLSKAAFRSRLRAIYSTEAGTPHVENPMDGDIVESETWLAKQELSP